jgi:hypothetical protein
MRGLVTVVAYRNKAVRVLLAEPLWIPNMVNMLGKITAKLTEARGASEREVPLALPFRGPQVTTILVAPLHCARGTLPQNALYQKAQPIARGRGGRRRDHYMEWSATQFNFDKWKRSRREAHVSRHCTVVA